MNPLNRKVLIIDDIKSNLTLLHRILGILMPEVIVLASDNGKDALKIAENELPDVVLVDLKMPEMDGFEVCRHLKENPATSFIPIIAVTGYGTDSQSRAKAFNSGADAFLAKPYDKTELKAQINAMLRIKIAEDKLRREKENLQNLVSTQDVLIKNREEKYSQLFKNMLDAFAIHQLETTPSGKPIDYRFLEINPAFEKETGLKGKNIVGEQMTKVLPNLEPVWLKKFGQVVKTGKPTRFRHYASPLEKYYEVMAFRTGDDEFATIFRDITAQMNAEEVLKKSVEEKELLLRDVHHRIKNNLAMISSLLNIQSRVLNDPVAREAFKKSRKRIGSIALLHEKLYRSNDLENVQFKDYVSQLTASLLDVSSLAEVSTDIITLNISIPPIHFDTDTLIPLGLLVTELVSNSIKHGGCNNNLNNCKPGAIDIKLEQDNERVTLSIADTGPGLPDDIDVKNTASLGLQLVHLLTEQLEGTIQFEKREPYGTICRLTFHVPTA